MAADIPNSEPTPAAAALPPLRSVHTTNFPALLRELGISLLVSTYQAKRLVLVRADGDTLNTHFRVFTKPMGLAVHGGRLALGSDTEIWEFHDLPAVAPKLDPPGKHDACFLPRHCHVTGDIQIHEMAWALPSGQRSAVSSQPNSGQRSAISGQPAGEPELWFVNTRFSCLCTRSPLYHFVPRWRPKFISALALDDRCHLNGMGLRDGQVRYATALGETDGPAGWRDNKRSGGVLMDVPANEVLLRGLSMPHSPRWYAGRLWLLESGMGGFGPVDLAAGKHTNLVSLPGFTRGLDFCGSLAFIGLSQVRETAVFSGIPIAERALAERACGVWVVHIETGQVVAFLRFEDAVQEIFAVQVLPRRFPDLINDDRKWIAESFVLPDEALAQVAAELRA